MLAYRATYPFGGGWSRPAVLIRTSVALVYVAPVPLLSNTSA
ncbi:unannotated protein [freshwater metagenome]|uniref:Unannotated protein n=1 Tax=freshwater metagenome TaxID=449393 RepID=A0A6J6YYG9_9ZZZZ